MTRAPALVALMGPTAAGKSRLAVELARRLGGEIVNADSMALYRGMDIGTAKPGPGDRGGVPHHLLDIWAVVDPASVADYQRRGTQVIAEIQARGVRPIVVGGSGLYLRAVLDDFTFPGTDRDLRARLEDELADGGPLPMHERLRALDPDGAAAIEPANGRRIVRALEVIALTGAPARSRLPSYDRPAPHARWAVHVGVDRPVAELDEMIADRAARMFGAGLVEEVASLLPHGFRDGPTAKRALGYHQALEVFDGTLTPALAIEATAAATRRFVRRQRSWFRRDPRIVWQSGTDLEGVIRTVEEGSGKGRA